MTSDEEPLGEQNHLESLVEMFVYAPVGMLYEYPEVLPQLVKRGKSQVQLAKLLGQMAVKSGQSGVEDSVGDAVLLATTSLAKGITEFGAMVGLAPPPAAEQAQADQPFKAEAKSSAAISTPIPNYDSLTAKEIVQLLEGLTVSQREQVGRYEKSNRARKTILAKLNQLSR